MRERSRRDHEKEVNFVLKMATLRCKTAGHDCTDAYITNRFSILLNIGIIEF